MWVPVCVCVCSNVLASVCEREYLFTSVCPWFLWIVTTVPHGASANYIHTELINDAPQETELGQGMKQSKHTQRRCDYVCICVSACSCRHENVHASMNILYSLYIRWPLVIFLPPFLNDWTCVSVPICLLLLQNFRTHYNILRNYVWSEHSCYNGSIRMTMWYHHQANISSIFWFMMTFPSVSVVSSAK